MANQRLNAIITIGGTVTGSLKSALGSTQKGLKQIGQEIRDLQSKQKALGKTIDAPVGRNVFRLKQEYNQLGDAIEKARKKQEKLVNAQEGMGRGKAMMASGATGLGVVGAVASAGIYPVVQAAQFETAMLGVAKQVEGARDENGKLTQVYRDMAKQVQMLGREIPLATNDIAAMVAEGAKMGVAKEHLIDFTRTAGMMSAAFELPAGELAESMGKIANLYKVPIPAIGDLADQINWLDDNAMSTGSDIIDFLTRTGSSAAMVKITGGQMAALGSTLLTLGEGAETASTATNAMFGKLAAADKGTKKFREALVELGLSASAIQTGMQVDAETTLIKVMDAVNKLPETKRMGVLIDMFGMEHADTAGKLAGNTAEYRKQIGLANSDGAKGSMSKEADAQKATAAAQWTIFKNQVGEVAVNIGNILLPAVNAVLPVISTLVTGVADWVRENPKLATSIATVAASVLGAVGAMNSVKMAIGGVKFAFNALKLVTATNPLGLAFVVLTTAAVLIYQNWEPIKAFFLDIWDSIKSYAEVAWTWIKDAFLNYSPIGLVVKNWEPIKAFFTGLFDNIKDTVRAAIDWILNKIAKVGDVWNATKSFFGFGDGGSAPAPRRVVSSPPPMATGRGNRTVQDNSQTTIHVTQPAGSDGAAFARALAKDNQRRAQGRQNNLLFDRPGG